MTLKKTLQQLPNHKPNNSKECNFYKLFCSMALGRNGNRMQHVKNRPTEYCSYLNEQDIYFLIKEYFPELLNIKGIKISENDFKEMLLTHMNTSLEIITKGYPVRLGGSIGTIGVQITRKKRQLPSTRFLPDRQKKYVKVRDAEIKCIHTSAKVSKAINIKNLSIEVSKKVKKQFIVNDLESPETYALTGPMMNIYAKPLSYARNI